MMSAIYVLQFLIISLFPKKNLSIVTANVSHVLYSFMVRNM